MIHFYEYLPLPLRNGQCHLLALYVSSKRWVTRAPLGQSHFCCLVLFCFVCAQIYSRGRVPEADTCNLLDQFPPCSFTTDLQLNPEVTDMTSLPTHLAL